MCWSVRLLYNWCLNVYTVCKKPYLPYFIIHHTTGCVLRPHHARDKQAQGTDRGSKTRARVMLSHCISACTADICTFLRIGISRSIQELDYQLDDPGISVQFPSRARKLLSTACRPAVMPTLAPSWWLSVTLFHGITRGAWSWHLSLVSRLRISGAIPPLSHTSWRA
jgi:hypothetical protein